MQGGKFHWTMIKLIAIVSKFGPVLIVLLLLVISNLLRRGISQTKTKARKNKLTHVYTNTQTYTPTNIET